MKQKRILIIEDQAIIAEGLRMELQALGHHVEVTNSFQTARLSTPTHIVMNIGTKDRMAADKSFLTAIPEGVNVIFVTGAQQSDLPDWVDGHTVVRKPYTQEDLIAALESSAASTEE